MISGHDFGFADALNVSPSAQETATSLSAILLVFVSGLIFSCMDTGAKYLVLSGLSATFVAWVRFAVHLIIVFVAFRGWQRMALYRVSSLPLQVVRGALLFGSTLFNFLALLTLQLAETVSIFFFAPMVITALAGPMLGEWAGWRRWMAVLAGFVGVLVILRPGLGGFGIGQIYALGAMLSYSLYVLMTRSMSASESPESLIFYSALAPVLLMLPAVPFTASLPATGLQWTILLSLGLLGASGHLLVIHAYRRAAASALAPYAYLQMVWMVGLGYLVFHQLPDHWTLIGAGIIVAGGLYIVQRERQLHLRNRAALNAEAGELAKRL